jgi:hypothetical protein
MVQSLPPQLGIHGTPVALPFGQHTVGQHTVGQYTVGQQTVGQQIVGLFFILYACRPKVCR